MVMDTPTNPAEYVIQRLQGIVDDLLDRIEAMTIVEAKLQDDLIEALRRANAAEERVRNLERQLA